MGFAGNKEVIDCIDAGRTSLFTWRKTPSSSPSAGQWLDLSMSPGNPVPNYYASSPLVAASLSQSTKGGIYHGVTGTGYDKRVLTFAAMTITSTAPPVAMYLLDYLLYYPYCDMSDTDLQYMDNSITLPRSTDGQNVKIMPIQVAAQTGSQTFRVYYTNQDGVGGRVTPTVTCNTSSVTGVIITSASATADASSPFIPLQAGDTGVTAIEAFEMLTPDVGLITLALVKPVVTHSILEITAPVEQCSLLDFIRLPKIEPDAYLNTIIHLGNGTVSSAPFHGYLQTVWRAE